MPADVDDEEVRFPPADFVRRGPPLGPRGEARRKQEKWARVIVVHPRPVETSERTRYDFVKKGPITLPMAVQREDASAGSKSLWQFFTHPYSVFPKDSAFFNVKGQGCLGARLFVRGKRGVLLYDEVGANLSDSEFVLESYHAALGVLRTRVLGDLESALQSEFMPDLLSLDLDLLQLFYGSTLLLKSKHPVKVLGALYKLFRKPTLHNFAWDLFTEEEHDLMRAAGDPDANPDLDQRIGDHFLVRKRDFTKVTDVRDGKRRQAIHEMQEEWERFEKEHGGQIAEIDRQIAECEQELLRIKHAVREVQDRKRNESGRLTRIFSRTDRTLKELKAEAVLAIRRKRELEKSYDEIPGYSHLKGITQRVKDYQDMVERIYQMAFNLVDHNVTRAQLNALRGLVRDQILSDDPAQVKKGYKKYDLRVRAELLPRLLALYSLSAYVLRRPESLRESPSRQNVERINRLALRLIEYFRFSRYGNMDMGEAFDSGWGQVLQLETRL